MWLLGVAASHLFVYPSPGPRSTVFLVSGEVNVGVLVSLATLVRMVALGFAIGIIVGLYFGMSGSGGSGSATCPPDRPGVAQCAPATTTPPGTAVNPEAAP